MDPADKNPRASWLRTGTKMLTLEVAIIALFVVPAAIYAATTLNTTISVNRALNANGGLIAHWTFDSDKLLQNATDSSGQGNNGFLRSFTSTTTVAGKSGQALSFDGVDDYVNAGHSSSLDISAGGAVTMCMWIYSDTGSVAGYQSVLAKRNAGLHAYGINFATNAFQVYTSGGSGVSAFAYNLPVQQWTHICGSLSAAPTALYVNGSLLFTNGGGGGVYSDAAFDLFVGAMSSSGVPGEFFDGILDDVRVYNRALSAAEVKRLYDLGGTTYVNTTVKSNPATSPSASSGLVGYWTFDGANLLQNVTDSSGQANHLRLRHFAATTTVPGRLGQGLDFDGTNDAAVSSSTPVSAVPLTLCAWFMRHSGNGVIVQVDDGEASGTADYFSLRITTGNLIARISVNSATSGTSGPAPTLDEWHHACAVYTSSTQRDLYYDGAFYDTNVTSGTPSGVIYTAVGDNTSSTNASLDGSIDDVRIYNRALSAGEVKRLYDLGGTTYVNTAVGSRPDLNRGLRGWWTLDGADSLQNIVDKSGNGHTGYFQSVTSTSSVTSIGKIGQGMKFNGTTEYIDTGDWSGSFTRISACTWVKPTSGSRQDYIGKWQGQFTLLQGVTTSKFQFYITGINGSSVSDTTISPGTWYHVCGTYDGSNIKLYVNGVQEGANVPVSEVLGGTGGTIKIGRSTDAFTSATLDDVRLYDRALSADEVARLYQLGL